MADLSAVVRELAARLAATSRLDPETRADAAGEARALVAAVLGISPAKAAWRATAGEPLAADEAHAIQAAAERRLMGEPLAYAVGSAPFRELVLAVDRRVLIPRPETEIVVEEALRCTAATPGGVAADIGTGSGAIALSLATEGHFERVIATDVSADALAVAAANADRIRPPIPVEFRMGADLAPLQGQPLRLLVANPPYIAHAEASALPGSVRDWEPPTALFADRDGMARYDVLLGGAMPLLEPGGWIVLEVDARRGDRTAALATAGGFASVRLRCDLSGRDRVLVAQRPE